MSVATETYENNIVIGSGEVYLDILDEAGAGTGERYLGDSVGASLSVATERVTVASGDGPAEVDLVDKVRSIERTLTLTLHDISGENLALFVGGAVGSSPEVAATRVTGTAAYEVRARRGRWYQIGASPYRPAGVGAVQDQTAEDKTAGAFDAGSKAVIVTTKAATPTSDNTLVRAESYTVDAARGRIFFYPGATGMDGANGTKVYIHYAPVAQNAGSRLLIRARTDSVEASLRYIESADSGAGRDYYAPRCTIAAGGELALKSREGEQQIQLAASILDPGDGRAALYVDGSVG